MFDYLIERLTWLFGFMDTVILTWNGTTFTLFHLFLSLMVAPAFLFKFLPWMTDRIVLKQGGSAGESD